MGGLKDFHASEMRVLKMKIKQVAFGMMIQKSLQGLFLKREVEQGCRAPLFYGIAYMDFQSGARICYPLGINLMVIILRDIWFWLKWPKGA